MNDLQQPVSKPSVAAERAAIVILILFGVFLVWLLTQARMDNEVHWSRLLALYSGVEAIAFTAAGVILGTRVQRAQVDAAESRAETMQVELQDSVKLAAGAEARGQSLRAAIETATPKSALESGGPEDNTLVELARKLFPNASS